MNVIKKTLSFTIFILSISLPAKAQSVITTIAGGINGDGQEAKNISFSGINDLAVDKDENIYIADRLNFSVRKIDAQTGIISTVAGARKQAYVSGGNALETTLGLLQRITVDNNNNLYVIENYKYIKKIDLKNNKITTVAGGGTLSSDDPVEATSVIITQANDVAIDSHGNIFYSDLYKIKKISGDGMVRTIAGDGISGSNGDGGPASAARITGTSTLCTDKAGNVYLNEMNIVRMISASDNFIYRIAGNGQSLDNNPQDGVAATSSAFITNYIACDSTGNVIVSAGSKIRGISKTTGLTYHVTNFINPSILTVSPNGVIYFTAQNRPQIPFNVQIFKVENAQNNLVAGNTSFLLSGFDKPARDAIITQPFFLATDRANNIFFTDQRNMAVLRIDGKSGVMSRIAGTGIGSFPSTVTNGLAVETPTSPSAITSDAEGNLYYIERSNCIRKLDISTGQLSVIAGTTTAGFSGDGQPANLALFKSPSALAVDSSGNIYIADKGNQRIRKINKADGTISTVVGPGLTSKEITAVINPSWITIDKLGRVYFSDGDAIRLIDSQNKKLNTIAGDGTPGFTGDDGPAISARLNNISGLTIDKDGNLYVSDAINYRIRKINVTTGIITTIAGNGADKYITDNLPAVAASLIPANLALDNYGNLIVADSYNERILKVSNVYILPIGLSSLKISRLSAESAVIKWTVTESNKISSFEIEKSNDGKTFHQIGTVYKNGTENYKFPITSSPWSTSYFRLKAMNIDGGFDYSSILSLPPQQSLINIYPNPTSGTLHFPAGTTTIELYDTAGRKVLTLERSERSEIADISGISNGVYIAVAKLKDGRTLKERIILNRQ